MTSKSTDDDQWHDPTNDNTASVPMLGTVIVGSTLFILLVAGLLDGRLDEPDLVVLVLLTALAATREL